MTRLSSNIPLGNHSDFIKRYGYDPVKKADGTHDRPYVSGYLMGHVKGFESSWYHTEDGFEKMLAHAKKNDFWFMTNDQVVHGGPKKAESDQTWKFKIGDRVIQIGNKDRWGSIGDRGTITELRPECDKYSKRNCHYVYVQYDDHNPGTKSICLVIADDELMHEGKWTNGDNRMAKCLNCGVDWYQHRNADCIHPPLNKRQSIKAPIAPPLQKPTPQRQDARPILDTKSIRWEGIQPLHLDLKIRKNLEKKSLSDFFGADMAAPKASRMPTGSRKFLLL